MRQTVRDGNLIKANPKCAQMWINEETKENRANLRAIVDLANDIDISVRQVGDILIVNGLKYDVSNLDMLLAPLSLEKDILEKRSKGWHSTVKMHTYLTSSPASSSFMGKRGRLRNKPLFKVYVGKSLTKWSY